MTFRLWCCWGILTGWPADSIENRASKIKKCQGDHGGCRANCRCCIPALAGFVSPHSMGPGTGNLPHPAPTFKQNSLCDTLAVKASLLLIFPLRFLRSLLLSIFPIFVSIGCPSVVNPSFTSVPVFFNSWFPY